MTSSGGWIKVYSSLLDWEWYSDTNMVRLFLHLLLKANYRPRRIKGVEYGRGQLVTSLPALSDETGLTLQVLRTCLTRLKSTGEITDESTTTGRVITILHYDRYQGENFDVNRPNNRPNNRRATDEQQTSNRPINNKNKEYNIISTTTTGARAYTREEFLADFFAEPRRASIEALSKMLGVSAVQLRQYAEEVTNEWEITEAPPHRDMHDARKHLINHLRIKIKNERHDTQTTPSYNSPDARAAKRQEAFADYIAGTIARPDDPQPDISAYY